jgi:hypothetical protein
VKEFVIQDQIGAIRSHSVRLTLEEAAIIQDALEDASLKLVLYDEVQEQASKFIEDQNQELVVVDTFAAA